MDELLSNRILCRYKLSLSAVRQIMYRNKDGVLIKCIELDNIDVASSELLKLIKQKICLIIFHLFLSFLHEYVYTNE